MTFSKRIICDTREQTPLIYSQYVLVKKLAEGDYCLEGLENHLVIERKAPCDLYGSIVQGHTRFVDEILRARLQGKFFYIVVECSEEEFYGKAFSGSHYCTLSGRVLAKIVSTLVERYGVIFVWCMNHVDAWFRVCDILEVNYFLLNGVHIRIDRKTGKISGG